MLACVASQAQIRSLHAKLNKYVTDSQGCDIKDAFDFEDKNVVTFGNVCVKLQ